MTHSTKALMILLALLTTGCDWEYFFDGDSYTSLATQDFATIGGCPVGANYAFGAKQLVTMIEELPMLRQNLADAEAAPLVIFTAGAVDAALSSDEEAAARLDHWTSEVLAVRPDIELVQLNYFGAAPWIALSNHANEPRWTVVEFPDLEDSGYLEPGPDGIHLTPASYVRRAAMLFRTHVRFACPDEDSGISKAKRRWFKYRGLGR